MDEQQYHPDFPAVNSIAPKTTPSRLGVELRQHVERGGSLTDKRLPSSAPRSPLTAPKKYARPQRKPARATPKGTEEVPVTPAGKAGEGWRIRKQEQKASLEDGKWAPKKRVARSTMERIRFLAINMPDTFDIPRLSYEFKISFEAVRRILRSNFNPSPEVIQTQESKRLALRKEYWSATQEANQPKPPTLPQPVTIITQRPKPKS
ncbi:hypothetical protein BJ085DRAFT_21343 [Dimargaris cristalligena]|uniref:Required for respiratory growth protein 9, mitochondrial n=1 Tax=Dimargaris cristalligena TaxID=215637 RepID=A0A4V1J3X5_9FUNG|nr:hypothetical protein BJ085DRAFT_21343 [Dimargaris cristalligena]|eukprot:RKP33579.1 hypothetical protein BJ085DRAFT_21343 [Dimargaris cristalligena]